MSEPKRPPDWLDNLPEPRAEITHGFRERVKTWPPSDMDRCDHCCQPTDHPIHQHESPKTPTPT